MDGVAQKNEDVLRVLDELMVVDEKGDVAMRTIDANGKVKSPDEESSDEEDADNDNPYTQGQSPPGTADHHAGLHAHTNPTTRADFGFG
jgi:hypothetical protein